MVMRRLLGSVLPALLVVAVFAFGCGDEDSGSASDDSTPTTSGSPTSGPPTKVATGDEVDFDLVDTITVTAAGGTLSEVAVPLSDEASVREFTSQFESDDMVQQVEQAAASADVPDGQALYAAVVSIGCDSPTDVSVTDSGAGLVISAGKVPSPQVECFAPMTTVALVVAPAS
jgi:hypothetical protein